MEKEEKIAERERVAEEMSFFGRLRQFFPAFALFWVSVVRLVLWYGSQVRTRGCTFIYMTQCLEIYNLPVTVFATFVSQTLVTNLTETGTVWPIDQDSLVFHGVFSLALGVISFGLKKILVKKKEDKDPVF